MEEVTTIQTPEQLDSVKRFSSEAYKRLENDGYLIYQLTGRSIQEIKAGHYRLGHPTPYESSHDVNLRSKVSEVALPSDYRRFFLPDSKYKTLAQQEEMIRRFSQDLAQQIPGVQAILGELPDYIELADLHLLATGERLFGVKYDYGFTRTGTVVKEKPGIIRNETIGYLSKKGFLYRSMDSEKGDATTQVAPLIVPA